MTEPHDDAIESRARCGKKTRQGRPCKNYAIPGGTVCRMHGGGAPQVRAKAEQRLMVIKIGEMLTREEIPFEDPLLGLLEEVARSGAAVRAYGNLVAELQRYPAYREHDADDFEVADEDDNKIKVGWGMPIGSLGPDHHGDLGVHPWIQLWNQERERHAKFCKAALDAGVAERQVRLAEKQGEIIARVVEQVLRSPELELPQAKQKIGKVLVATALRELSEAV